MLSHLRKHIEEIATDFMTSTRRGEELHPVDHALYENTNKKDFMKQVSAHASVCPQRDMR